MSGACLVCGGMAIGIKYHLKRENARFEEQELRGEVHHKRIQGSKAGHGGEAVVSFRYVH